LNQRIGSFVSVSVSVLLGSCRAITRLRKKELSTSKRSLRILSRVVYTLINRSIDRKRV